MDHGFDTGELERLGKRFQRLREQLDELRPLLAAEIQAATAAGVPQAIVARLSTYTRDQVRQIILPPEKKRSRAKAATG
jgi:hypothetical protein